MNADVQGMAKWIELNLTGNCCASVQSAFPAVVACYAMFKWSRNSWFLIISTKTESMKKKTREIRMESAVG